MAAILSQPECVKPFCLSLNVLRSSNWKHMYRLSNSIFKGEYVL